MEVKSGSKVCCLNMGKTEMLLTERKRLQAKQVSAREDSTILKTFEFIKLSWLSCMIGGDPCASLEFRKEFQAEDTNLSSVRG